MTMITPSYLGDTIEYSSYASNALGALPYGRPAGGREFTSDSITNETCGGCAIKLDVTQVYKGTYSAATYHPDLGSLGVGMQFTGRLLQKSTTQL